MKLEMFTPDTFYHKPNRAPAITINDKGTFRLNTGIIALLSLSAGDTVTLSRSDEQDWFIAKTPTGYPLAATGSENDRALLFHSKDLFRIMHVQFKALPTWRIAVGKLPVNVKGVDWFPLFTAPLTRN